MIGRIDQPLQASSRSSARAGWASSTRPRTRSSSAQSRSSSCRQHLLGNEDVRKRFEREAKVGRGSLSRQHLHGLRDRRGRRARPSSRWSLVEGESLDKKIARKARSSSTRRSRSPSKIAKGLEAAHKRGIVPPRHQAREHHGRRQDGHVTIMDFGLAQLTEASRLTKTDETVGTVAYMSPEQTEGSGPITAPTSGRSASCSTR